MLRRMSARGPLGETVRVFGAVLRNPDVRRLELAWAASNFASRASAVAVAVFAYEADGAAAVGVVVFVRLLAAAALAPWLAVLADRYARRLVLLGSEAVRVVLLAAMAVLAAGGRSDGVYILAVLVAVAEPVFRSAQVALTPSLVRDAGELTAANVVASAVESVGLFGGPALGALVLARWSPAAVFGVTAGLLLVALWLVARIGAEERRLPADAALQLGVPEFGAGFATIVREPGVRVVVALFAVQTLVAGLFNVLVVLLALELLDLGEAGVGWLDGAVGVGATVGIVAVAGLAGRAQLARAFALGLLLWGVPLVLVAARPSAALAFVLFALVGVGNTLVDVSGITLMQRAAPDAVLARVFGAFEALTLLTMGLGSLLAPALDALFGVRGATLAAGLVLPAAVVLSWRSLAAVDGRAAAPAERVALLRAVPLFAPLPVPELERMAGALEELRVEEGTAVVREGDSGDRFYVLAEGRALVEAGGRELGELGRGDVFGEIALLGAVPRTATVRALTPLRVLALDGETFVSVVTGHAAAADVARPFVAARLARPVAL